MAWRGKKLATRLNQDTQCGMHSDRQGAEAPAAIAAATAFLAPVLPRAAARLARSLCVPALRPARRAHAVSAGRGGGTRHRTSADPAPVLSQDPRTVRESPARRFTTAVSSATSAGNAASKSDDAEPHNGSGGSGADDGKTKRVRMTGFNSPVVLTQELADALMDGHRVMSRSQAASRISEYAQKQGLCPAEDKRVFMLDDTLSRLFPTAPAVLAHRLVTGILRPHIIPVKDATPDLQLLMEEFRKSYIHRVTEGSHARKQDRRGHHSKEVQKRMRAQGRGFFVPVALSDELAEICGAKSLPRSDVTKLVWKYIKSQDLQDARDRRTIRLDDKLRAVCGDLDAVNCFKLSKYISRHILSK